MERRKALKQTAIAAGSVALTPALFSLLQSCQQQTRLEWEPQFLNHQQASFISSMVDTILPKTDTPGGLEVKVDIFIDKVFAEIYDQEQQTAVVREIEQFDQKCREQFGDSFAKLNDKERTEVLKNAESTAGKFNGKVWGTAVGTQQPVGFYRNLKSMILWGYFTSAEIGKNVLNYDPVPGAYLGCIPLSEVGNIWSL
ncbi:MAG: hypothetical protein DHS20C17_30750 [Cyclobacteriaceae bacterium]|nr:MAG: hypothetical protein DHS20C17_30750 [Cyclobacteriaceae bacterium]